MSSPITFNLWPARAPHATADEPDQTPTLTWYRPTDPTGAAIVVCPGGGYTHLAEHENEPICEWLSTLGITAFGLKYRKSPFQHPAPLTDARRAIQLVRHRADEFGIDATRVGILGFSAGGHLAATASTQFKRGSPDGADEVDRQSSRPDLTVLAYPVITLESPFAHVGSRENLLGKDATAETISGMCAEKNVTSQTPPAFIFFTADDAAVPVENGMLYASALRKNKVGFELHVFQTGPHGVGLATNRPALAVWTSLCATWLKANGF